MAEGTLQASAPPGSGQLPDLAAGWISVAAACALVLLMAVSARYGYHRDELYFLEASRHMAWGYVDQPPASVALIWVARVLLGGSVVAIRVFPALAEAATVVLTGMIARELGGRRFAQGFAALTAATGPVFIATGHLAGTTVYDFLAWAAVSLLVLRILRTGNVHLWLAVGAVLGLALLNKETILLLVASLALGLVANRQWAFLRTPWLAAGAVVALVIWSPNLLWQAQHGWPTIAMSRSLHQEHSGLGDSIKFLPDQLLYPGWWVAPIWLAGLWGLLRDPRLRPYRALAYAYAVLFVWNCVFIGDRPYYLAGLYLVLLAAGAGILEDVVAGRRGLLRTRAARWRLIWRSPRSAVVFVVVIAAIGMPLSLPILPASALHTVPLQKVNYDLGEQVGWRGFVAAVAQVYRSVPPGQQASVVIVTNNYGEAGAIDRYGPADGLPRAESGQNSFWYWGTPEPASGLAILVGFSSDELPSTSFRKITLAATFHNREGVQDDEEGAQLWLCRDQVRPWPALWPSFRYDG